MNVENTVRNRLLLYPSLFENRWSVYHNLFCVNGNGYEWINGELTCSEKENIVSIEEVIEKHFCFRVSDKDLLNNPLKFSIKNLKEDILATINIEQRMNDFASKDKIYPLCKWANIMNIPKDIKPDWLEAVKMFYDYLIANYNNFNDQDKKRIDRIKIP